MRFALRHLFERLSYLEGVVDILQGESLTLDAELKLEGELPPGEAGVSLPCWIEFEGVLFFAVNSRPIWSFIQEDGITKAITGPPTRTRSAILKGMQAENQRFIDLESESAHRQPIRPLATFRTSS